MPALRSATLAALVMTLAAADPGLENPGFEGAFVDLPAKVEKSGARITGALGAGWMDNSSWADVDVAYAAETADPHSGKAAQTISITRFASGGVQFVHPVRYRKGIGIRFSCWLRGRPGQTVSIMLRQEDAPWKAYATTTAALSAEWREFRVQGVPEQDEGGFLMIKAGEPMRFQIDDARLEDLATISNDAPVKPGNLISGGSFETAEVPFGWSTRQQGDPDWVWRDVAHRTDQGGAVGGRSLRIDVQAGGSAGTTCSPVFIPNGNRAHSASVWLKASRPAKARIALDNTTIARDLDVGTGWQRHSVSGTIPFIDWSRLRIISQPQAEAVTMWIDGAAVEELAQPSAAFVPAAPIEVALTLARSGHIVHDGEAAAATLSLSPAPPAGATLDLAVEDILGGTTRLPALALPAGQVALPVLPGRPRGMFKLTATVRDAAGAALSAPAELIWSRLPRPRELAPERSYFGVHIPLTPDYIAMAKAAGMRWIRFHDTSMIGKWPVAEYEPGKWNFFDAQVDAAHAAGLGIVGMLDGAPARVASKKREGGYWGIWHLPDLPGAMDAWRTYVRTVTTHYRGRIGTWEVWNEPWGDWWRGNGGSPEAYAVLMQAAYAEAKQADPALTILGVDTYRGNDWTEKVLAASGTGCFDALSFHDYNDALYGGEPSFARRQVDAFTAAMAKVGTAKPLWNTEGGLFGVGSWYAPVTGGMAARAQLAYAVRYDVCMLAAGVKAYVMYGVHSNGAMGETDCRDDEHDRAIKPVIAARAVLAALIDGVGTPVRSEPQPGVDRHAFPAENGRSVAVYWANDGQDHELAVPAGAEVLDVLGSPKPVAGGRLRLDQEPVYIIAAP